ncbi:hypothetical protein JOC34_000488 [Virgibacillus halotolerans]|nr:hypothetical protein [Virgibacillus halotolerans]
MSELLSEYKHGSDQYETRCNKCLSYFESDDELELFYEDANDLETGFKGCPECETDNYLMDLN